MSDSISPTGSPGPVLSTPLPVSSAPVVASGMGQAQTKVQAKAQGAVVATSAKQQATQATILEVSQAQAEKPNNVATEPVTVEEAAKEFRTYLKNLPSDLQFRVDKESGYVVFKVVNPVTQEVIRQYPPDEVLEMAKRLKASANQGKNGSGIFLDGKA